MLELNQVIIQSQTEFLQIPVDKELNKILLAAAEIVVDVYVDEAPKDEVQLAGTTEPRIEAGRVVVGSKARNKGFQYPLAVHEGTGKYKGKPDFGKTTGRVRQSNNYGFKTRQNMEAFFAVQAIRGFRPSIKPNKFALRTKRLVQDDVLNFIETKIGDRLK